MKGHPNPEQAKTLHFHGSPSFIVNGPDLFPSPASPGAFGDDPQFVVQIPGLYKYFPDLESMLLAWHQRQIQAHLAELTRNRDRTEGVRQQLEEVLHAYAFLSRPGHGDAEAARLHQGGVAGPALHSLQAFLAALIHEGAATAVFRADVAPEELAAFYVHALKASAELASPEAVLRLVNVTLDALRPPQPPAP